MVRGSHKIRYAATPSRIEVNIRAIPILPQTGWKLLSFETFPTVGTVPKNYLTYGNPGLPGRLGYFAKKGRIKADARECVTEEIISKIGAMLPLEMARSKLVRIAKNDVRFLSQNFVVRGQYELRHGIELVAQFFETTPTDVESVFNLQDRKAEQKFYTITTILTILEYLFPNDFPELKERFFKMIAFDAFIGAPDRHAMNWGVLAPLDTDSKPVRYSPIFDTARGLFRECSDADLIKKTEQQGREQFLERYANRSQPIFSTDETQQHNHFSLVRWISENCMDTDRRAMCTVFEAVDIPSIEHLLQRRFRRIITQTRIEFIRDLLSFRIKRLREEVRI